MKYFLVISFLFTSAASFAEKAMIANCTEGEGCTFELTDIDKELLETEKIELGKGEILVMGTTKFKETIIYADKNSREQIDKDWGGDGYTQIGLFNPNILPKSGLWKVSYGSSTGNDCYGIGNIGAFIRKRISPGVAGSGNIQFSYPFNPSKLFPSSDMRWVKTGFASYKGILDFGGMTVAGMKMTYYVKIINEQKIETYYSILVRVPTKEDCVAKVPVTFTLLKAEELEDIFGEEDVENNPDDLLEIKPKGKDEDLLEVKPKEDLLPVETGKKPKPNVERISDNPKANIPRLED